MRISPVGNMRTFGARKKNSGYFNSQKMIEVEPRVKNVNNYYSFDKRIIDSMNVDRIDKIAKHVKAFLPQEIIDTIYDYHNIVSEILADGVGKTRGNIAIN